MSEEVRKLRRRGVSDDDLQLALDHQVSQRRAGAPVQRLSEIVGLDPVKRKSAVPVPLQPRQLRKKDAGEQASLIARQLALMSKSPVAAVELRHAANLIDKNSNRLETSEFDFMSNVSIGHQYIDAIEARLLNSGATLAQQSQALSVLLTLTRFIKFQSYEVEITSSELAERKGIAPPHLSNTLKLLETVGAIKRTRKGKFNAITITPEGVYRGPIQQHAITVKKYRLEVVKGGKSVVHDKQLEA